MAAYRDDYACPTLQRQSRRKNVSVTVFAKKSAAFWVRCTRATFGGAHLSQKKSRSNGLTTPAADLHNGHISRP